MSLGVDDADIGPVATRSGRRKRDGRGGCDDHQRARTRPTRRVVSPGISVASASGHDENGDRDRGGGDEIVATVAVVSEESSKPPGSRHILEGPAATGGGSLTPTGWESLDDDEGAAAVPRFESLPTELMSIIFEFMNLSSLVRLARCGRRFDDLVHAPGTRMYLKVYFGTMPTLARPSKDPVIRSLIRFLERIDARAVSWSPAHGYPEPSRWMWTIVSHWSPSSRGSGAGGGDGRDWRDILSSPNFLGMKIFVEVGGGRSSVNDRR